MEFQMNSITNSVAAKQVFIRILNEFFDSSPKWWEPNEPLEKLPTSDFGDKIQAQEDRTAENSLRGL
jgi:hypothetical protein